jgi:hypothetical protein
VASLTESRKIPFGRISFIIIQVVNGQNMTGFSIVSMPAPFATIMVLSPNSLDNLLPIFAVFAFEAAGAIHSKPPISLS